MCRGYNPRGIQQFQSMECGVVAFFLLLLPQEDVSVTEKRAAVRLLYDKIKMAIDDVQYKQEKVKRKDHEGDNVSSIGWLHGRVH